MYDDKTSYGAPPPSPPFVSTQDDQNPTFLRSPTIPSSPAPAYTALPYRDEAFHLAPVLGGKVGDVELETVDGKRFLVHKKLLEHETVFFHIYYGFVPAWRLSGTHPNAPPHPSFPPSSTQPSQGALNNLLCLPKLLASHLRASPPPSNANSTVPPCQSQSTDRAPPVPPKDIITAPTPTSSPYTWLVPETSPILQAFLSLIYPPGLIPPPTRSPFSGRSALPTLDLTARVIRAALGYQSNKALSASRDHLSSFIPFDPVGVYATATFFKFTDLAQMASMSAVGIPSGQWKEDTKVLMGRAGRARLERLQGARIKGLRTILGRQVEVDGHSEGCVSKGTMGGVWERKVSEVRDGLGPGSELMELLEMDLREARCGECLVLLAGTVKACLEEARGLPRCV